MNALPRKASKWLPIVHCLLQRQPACGKANPHVRLSASRTLRCPQDRFLHQVLAVSMLLCCAGCAAEAAVPDAYTATALRVLATLVQGLMFMVIAEVKDIWGRECVQRVKS
jgi:hypothetical protein